jgi:hypothetical protein
VLEYGSEAWDDQKREEKILLLFKIKFMSTACCTLLDGK